MNPSSTEIIIFQRYFDTQNLSIHFNKIARSYEAMI